MRVVHVLRRFSPPFPPRRLPTDSGDPLRRRTTASHRSLRVSPAPAMAEASGSRGSERANRLASEHSPYLLQHAHNPVDWYPWGEEAFQNARQRNVPIFLSIGYSTCHWCHVMEAESFEDEVIAKMLNDWFVSIKVDREERPDVDRVYMTYVQALYGGGGWPLSVFLSPDLRPLMGGTYFPPDDNYGRPGFKTVLRKVKQTWDTKRETLEKSGAFVIDQLSEALSAKAGSKKLKDGIPEISLQTCVQQLAGSYDQKYGGFGSAPKFPRPVEIQVLLYQSKKLEEKDKGNEAKDMMKMVCFTLQCMARGGIHDHLGGGFHRYSVDECWHVPHFEKMLYDQGQIANVYMDTFLRTQDLFYSSITRDVLDYIIRDLTGAQGEIYSAEDADSAESHGASKKKEGAFYVWKNTEVEGSLGETANMFKEHYYIKPSGNTDLSSMSDPHKEFEGQNVLIEKYDVPTMASKWHIPVSQYSDIIALCRQKLFEVRCKRPRPHLDDKVIVSWNGLIISAFARASKILKTEPKDKKFYFPIVSRKASEYLQAGEKAASFIRRNLYDEQTCKLNHSFRNGPSNAPGFLDDYAFLIWGLLDLFEYGGKTSWLSWAIKLQESQDKLFLDENGGGYFNTTEEDPSVLFRVKEDNDAAEPSGNSVAAINLLRLSSLTEDSRSHHYRQTAEHLLAVFEPRLKDQALAIPLMCCAADMLSVPSRKQVVLAGDKSSSEFEDMVVASHASYDPNKTVIQIDPNDMEDMEFWESYNPMIASIAKNKSNDKVAVAYVCQNFTCSPPVTDSNSLESLLHQRPAGSSE